MDLYKDVLVDGVKEESVTAQYREIYLSDLGFLSNSNHWETSPYTTLWFQTNSYFIRDKIGEVDQFHDELMKQSYSEWLSMNWFLNNQNSYLNDIDQFKFFTKVLSQEKLWHPKTDTYHDSSLAYYLDVYVNKIKQENNEGDVYLAQNFYATLYAVLDEKNISTRYYALFDANKKLLPPWWKVFGLFSTKIETCANVYERCAKIDQGEECKLLKKCELDD